MNLSGGNQQKVVLAKWLASKVRVFVLDHPTRGVDVGAKEDVYELVRALAQEGIAVLLMSDTSTRRSASNNVILTMKDGRVTAAHRGAGRQEAAAYRPDRAHDVNRFRCRFR